MSENYQHLILGRLQEVSILYVDRVVSYLASGAHRRLPPQVQTELMEALDGVTMPLSRFAMAVLGVAGFRLEVQLLQLFTHMRRLHEVANPLGVLPMASAFNMYRPKLVESGLSYLDSEDFEIPTPLRPAAAVDTEA